jgi:hypothetical protein
MNGRIIHGFFFFRRRYWHPVILTALLFSLLAGCGPIEAATTATPKAEPSPTPTLFFTPIPDPFAASTPNPEKQVYLDPDGWYFVELPADMKPTGDPGSFESDMGFFETGYLPEMGYVSSPLQVCLWYANVVARGEQSVIMLAMLGNQYDPHRCDVQVKEVTSIAVGIFENPGADPSHRFIFTKYKNKYAGQASVRPIGWLKPFTEELPPFALAPLTAEETAFWESAAPMPDNIKLTEYILPAEAQTLDPYVDYQFWTFVPPEAFPTHIPSAQNDKTKVEEQFASAGYDLRSVDLSQGRQIYRDGRILFDHVIHVSDVYRFTSEAGPITAFIVETLPSVGTGYMNRFLVENDVIRQWSFTNNDPRYAPVLYQGELLWVREAQERNAHVVVQKSDQRVVFNFASYFGATLEMDNFTSWDGHWILEVGDLVTLDGEFINQKFDFQEVHDWHLVNGKPFYFFHKGQRVGISYDDQFLPVFYHKVLHGGCCGYGAYNPNFINNTVGFYAQREGVWMYVLMEFK